VHYLTKIVLDKVDDATHKEFTKYGRGEFEGPRIVVKSKNILRLEGSFGYESFIGEFIVKNIPEDNYKVNGKIFTHSDESDFLSNFGITLVKDKKKPLYVANVKGLVLNSNDLKKIYERLIEGNYLFLSITPESKANKTKITTKTTFPRPPTKGDIEVKTDFCKGQIENNETLRKALIQGLIPDFIDEIGENFKTIELSNKIIITNLELPKDTQVKNPRIAALRIGKLIRTLKVDGKELKSEKEFKV